MRTTFTGRQIFDLEKAFEAKKYLSSSERAEMASALNVTQQQVTKGFKKLCASKSNKEEFESRQNDVENFLNFFLFFSGKNLVSKPADKVEED